MDCLPMLGNDDLLELGLTPDHVSVMTEAISRLSNAGVAALDKGVEIKSVGSDSAKGRVLLYSHAMWLVYNV